LQWCFPGSGNDGGLFLLLLVGVSVVLVVGNGHSKFQGQLSLHGVFDSFRGELL
jgi:hypothetical protein